MNLSNSIIATLILASSIGACTKQATVDREKPAIDHSIAGASPLNCDTLYFGDTLLFRARFADNEELGSAKAYSIDIHHNFDQHSHSTEVSGCHLGAKQEPVLPFTYIGDFDIPAGSVEYETWQQIFIPATNGVLPYDEGLYHFFISLTDKQGWSAQSGLSIRILHRNK